MTRRLCVSEWGRWALGSSRLSRIQNQCLTLSLSPCTSFKSLVATIMEKQFNENSMTILKRVGKCVCGGCVCVTERHRETDTQKDNNDC